jgi:hypothetical protein
MWQILSSDQTLLRDTTARFLIDQVPLSRLRKDRHDPAGLRFLLLEERGRDGLDLVARRRGTWRRQQSAAVARLIWH